MATKVCASETSVENLLILINLVFIQKGIRLFIEL